MTDNVIKVSDELLACYKSLMNSQAEISKAYDNLSRYYKESLLLKDELIDIQKELVHHLARSERKKITE